MHTWYSPKQFQSEAHFLNGIQWNPYFQLSSSEAVGKFEGENPENSQIPAVSTWAPLLGRFRVENLRWGIFTESLYLKNLYDGKSRRSSRNISTTNSLAWVCNANHNFSFSLFCRDSLVNTHLLKTAKCKQLEVNKCLQNWLTSV